MCSWIVGSVRCRGSSPGCRRARLVGGPGQHHEAVGGRSSAVPKAPSAPAISGSSGCSGMNTVPLPPFSTRSRPWSKNWPKNMNHGLNGADRPSSGRHVLEEEDGDVVGGAEDAVQARPAADDRDAVVQYVVGGAPDPVLAGAHPPPPRRPGCWLVWSTIRLEMMRGSASTTLPVWP